MFIEYNELMESAGHGKVATAQMVRYGGLQSKTDTTVKKDRDLFYIKCQCGKSITKSNIARHQKTEKCKRKMQSISAKDHVLILQVHDHLVASLQEEEQESQPLLPQLSGQPPFFELPVQP